MKKNLILLLSIFVFSCSTPQPKEKINLPFEIIRIMEASELNYIMNSLEDEIIAEDLSSNINSNGFYRTETQRGFSVDAFVRSKEVQEIMAQAEDHFSNNNMPEARKYYLMAIEVSPENTVPMTYIGQTYEIERNYDEAAKWYRKVINLNYIDFMAHWFLADIYFSDGQINKAVDEITIAHILNRNNPRLIKSMLQIFDAAKLGYKVRPFVPQMKIEQIDKESVNIYVSGDWLGFALAKAVWLHEPGYREERSFGKGYSTLEDKECLLGLINVIKNPDEKRPEFLSLKFAFDKNLLNEFIYYEITLPQNPDFAYYLSKSTIESIKKYILEVRCKVD